MSKTNKPKEIRAATIEEAIETSDQRLSMVIKSHPGLLKIAFFSVLAVVLCLAVLLAYIIKSKPEPKYFASTNDGRLVELTPLNSPLLSVQAVEAFAARAISNTFTFDYANYEKQLGANSDSFTPKAFDEIKANLESHYGIVTQAIQNNWIVTANIMAAPTVAKTGVMANGRYGWHLIFPIRMTFQTENDVRSAQYQADAVIVRVSQQDTPSGIAIAQLNLTQGDSQ